MSYFDTKSSQSCKKMPKKGWKSCKNHREKVGKVTKSNYHMGRKVANSRNGGKNYEDKNVRNHNPGRCSRGK